LGIEPDTAVAVDGLLRGGAQVGVQAREPGDRQADEGDARAGDAGDGGALQSGWGGEAHGLPYGIAPSSIAD
jgi:hypothetical protein